MFKAVIDLGTNSIKCLIAEVDEEEIRIHQDLMLTTRLGADLAKDGLIKENTWQSNIQALKQLKQICAQYHIAEENIVCVGAETLRKAANADEFKSKVQKETGWTLHILSPRQEASLSYRAAIALAPDDADQVMVFDTGGGSTEFSFGSQLHLYHQDSLPLGAVVLTQKFLSGDPISPAAVSKLQDHLNAVLSEAFPVPQKCLTIGCGGTVTSLAAIKLALSSFDPLKVQGSLLSDTVLSELVKLLLDSDLEQRKQIPGLHPDRADIIPAGALIVQAIMKHFALKEILVSARGIRHALLTQMVPRG